MDCCNTLHGEICIHSKATTGGKGNSTIGLASDFILCTARVEMEMGTVKGRW